MRVGVWPVCPLSCVKFSLHLPDATPFKFSLHLQDFTPFRPGSFVISQLQGRNPPHVCAAKSEEGENRGAALGILQ